MSDPLDMAPEMVPFLTGAELERRREIEAQLAQESRELAAFYRQHEKDIELGYQRQRERQERARRRLERPRR